MQVKDALVRLFSTEAEHAWVAKKYDTSVITLAVSQIFCLACHTARRDALPQELVSFGKVTAKSLGLMGIPEDSQPAACSVEQSPEWRRAAAHIT